MPEENIPAEAENHEEPVVGEAPPTNKSLLSNSVYDKLKFVAQVLLPALGTLYFGLSGYWHFPHPDEVVGSIVVVDTFLGVLLGVTNRQYMNDDENFDGVIVVSPGPKGEPMLNVGLDSTSVVNKDVVQVRVRKQ